MIFIIILIAVSVFGIYQFKQYKAGKFRECSIQSNKLYRLLFVLPAAQLVVALVSAWFRFTNIYEFDLRLILLAIIPLAYLVVNIFLLAKKNLPIKFCVIYTVILSFVLGVDFCREFMGGAYNCNFTEILFLIDSDWFVILLVCGVIFSALLILQFYYVRWITRFYGLHSPFEGWNLMKYVKASPTFEQPISVSEPEASNNIDIKKKSDMLHDLKQLLDDGILTKEEFEAEKNKILNS